MWINRQAKVLRFLLLLGAALAISGCDQGDNAGVSSDDSRVRLNSNNAYAQFGNYVIHVSAMLSSDLSPEVAQSYDIVRSQNQALVNLVVLQKTAGVAIDTPVKAQVTLSAANLTGQLKDASLREVTEGSSIYYIGLTAVDDREIINFDFDVRPAGSNREMLVRFSHEFYTR